MQVQASTREATESNLTPSSRTKLWAELVWGPDTWALSLEQSVIPWSTGIQQVWSPDQV